MATDLFVIQKPGGELVELTFGRAPIIPSFYTRQDAEYWLASQLPVYPHLAHVTITRILGPSDAPREP